MSLLDTLLSSFVARRPKRVPVRQWAPPSTCRVDGCDAYAAPGDDVCSRCRDELAALREWHEEHDPERFDGLS